MHYPYLIFYSTLLCNLWFICVLQFVGDYHMKKELYSYA